MIHGLLLRMPKSSSPTTRAALAKFAGERGFRAPVVVKNLQEGSDDLVVYLTARSEGKRKNLREVPLDEHEPGVARRAYELALAAGLGDELAQRFREARLLHHHGKDHPVWQRAMGATDAQRPAAKTAAPANMALLDGYRHEFGSLLKAAAGTDDLTLHFVAAHHAAGRPFFKPRNFDPRQSEEKCSPVAREAEKRFARLQNHYGAWGRRIWRRSSSEPMGWYQPKRETGPVAEVRVRLDPRNPGQFYACCGLLELAALEDPDILSAFSPEQGRPRVHWFSLRGDLPENFLTDSLRRLKQLHPDFDTNSEAGVSPAKLPFGSYTLELDWWLDEFRGRTASIKCWAGQVTTRGLFEELLGLLDLTSTGLDLFEKSQLTKSKFGVDPRAAWNACDYGYSPNEHGKDSATFIAVEVLAAIGLQSFRPVVQRKTRRAAYHLWTGELPACLARTASFAPWDGLPHFAFEFSIASRGQSYK